MEELEKIEVVEKTPITAEKRKEKFRRYKKKISIFLFGNWKNDLRKIWKLLLILAFALIVLELLAFYQGSFLGWKFDFFLKKVNYKNYTHLAPDFSYRYADYFETDSGEGKNYGDNYLSGFKLGTDPRTGCDIRMIKSGINFQKNDAEIRSALSKELSASAKDFKLINAHRMKIDGENAFALDFSFIDPIGSRVRVNQVMTGHENNFYVLICGTGDYQYQFFEKDFKDFTNSFRWNSK